MGQHHSVHKGAMRPGPPSSATSLPAEAACSAGDQKPECTGSRRDSAHAASQPLERRVEKSPGSLHFPPFGRNPANLVTALSQDATFSEYDAALATAAKPAQSRFDVTAIPLRRGDASSGGASSSAVLSSSSSSCNTCNTEKDSWGEQQQQKCAEFVQHEPGVERVDDGDTSLPLKKRKRCVREGGAQPEPGDEGSAIQALEEECGELAERLLESDATISQLNQTLRQQSSVNLSTYTLLSQLLEQPVVAARHGAGSTLVDATAVAAPLVSTFSICEAMSSLTPGGGSAFPAEVPEQEMAPAARLRFLREELVILTQRLAAAGSAIAALNEALVQQSGVRESTRALLHQLLEEQPEAEAALRQAQVAAAQPHEEEVAALPLEGEQQEEEKQLVVAALHQEGEQQEEEKQLVEAAALLEEVAALPQEQEVAAALLHEGGQLEEEEEGQPVAAAVALSYEGEDAAAQPWQEEQPVVALHQEEEEALPQQEELSEEKQAMVEEPPEMAASQEEAETEAEEAEAKKQEADEEEQPVTQPQEEEVEGEGAQPQEEEAEGEGAEPQEEVAAAAMPQQEGEGQEEEEKVVAAKGEFFDCEEEPGGASAEAPAMDLHPVGTFAAPVAVAADAAGADAMYAAAPAAGMGTAAENAAASETAAAGPGTAGAAAVDPVAPSPVCTTLLSPSGEVLGCRILAAAQVGCRILAAEQLGPSRYPAAAATLEPAAAEEPACVGSAARMDDARTDVPAAWGAVAPAAAAAAVPRAAPACPSPATAAPPPGSPEAVAQALYVAELLRGCSVEQAAALQVQYLSPEMLPSEVRRALGLPYRMAGQGQASPADAFRCCFGL